MNILLLHGQGRTTNAMRLLGIRFHGSLTSVLARCSSRDSICASWWKEGGKVTDVMGQSDGRYAAQVAGDEFRGLR